MCFAQTNALAYYIAASFTAVKKFCNTDPGWQTSIAYTPKFFFSDGKLMELTIRLVKRGRTKVSIRR